MNQAFKLFVWYSTAGAVISGQLEKKTSNSMMDFWKLILLTIIIFMALSHQSAWAKVVTDLLDVKQAWKAINYAKIRQNNSLLEIIVNTENSNKIYNRAYLNTTISSESVHNFLSLVYSTNTTLNTMFAVEVIKKPVTSGVTKSTTITLNSTEIPWIKNLGLSLGFFTKRTYEIPEAFMNIPIQIRFYLITDGPGENVFNITRAIILDSCC